MKKSSIVLLSIIAFFTILIGFIYKSFADEKPKVVVVFKELNSQYWEIVKAGAEKGFQDFSIDGKVIAPKEASAEEQGEMLEMVLNENPDVLIVSPIDPEIIPVLEEFAKKNIPVLLLDTDVPWENKASYIGTDNFDLGRKAGALLASQLQPGDKVALIGGGVNSPVGGGRLQGAEITLLAAGIKIAAEVVNLTNEFSQVKEAMEMILKDHPDVKGVIASNDTMALHALKVIEEHGLKMPVTGADGIIEMVKLIEEGTLPGTVAQNPYDMGYLSVEAASKVAKGENIEKNIDSGVDIIIKGNAKQRLDFLEKLLK